MSGRTNCQIIMVLDWILWITFVVLLMGALYSVKDGFTEFNRTAAEIAWDNEVAVNKSKGPNPPPRRSKKEEDFGLSARNVAAILVTACGLLGTGVQFILNILISIGLSKQMGGYPFLRSWVIIHGGFWLVQLVGICIGLITGESLYYLGGLPYLIYRSLAMYLVRNYHNTILAARKKKNADDQF